MLRKKIEKILLVLRIIAVMPIILKVIEVVIDSVEIARRNLVDQNSTETQTNSEKIQPR